MAMVALLHVLLNRATPVLLEKTAFLFAEMEFLFPPSNATIGIVNLLMVAALAVLLKQASIARLLELLALQNVVIRFFVELRLVMMAMLILVMVVLRFVSLRLAISVPTVQALFASLPVEILSFEEKKHVMMEMLRQEMVVALPAKQNLVGSVPLLELLAKQFVVTLLFVVLRPATMEIS